MQLLAVIAGVLVGIVVTAVATVLICRDEVLRIAQSRAELAQQWRLLAQVWNAIDPKFRPTKRLTLPQQAALYIALIRKQAPPREGSNR